MSPMIINVENSCAAQYDYLMNRKFSSKEQNLVNRSQVKSSHYYLYSAFNNANCVRAALHQLDIKLGGFTSALQYLDGEIVCRNSVILLLSDKISSLNLGCSRVRLCKGLIWFLWSCPDSRLGDRVFTGDQSLGLI